MSYQEEYDDRRRMEFLHSNKQGLSLEFWPKKHGASEDRTTHFKWFVVRRDEAGVLCDFAPCHGAPLPFSQEARLIIDIYRIKGVSGATPVALGDPAKDVSATAAHAALPATKALGIPSQDIARPASIILSMSVEERRDQRRYEIARDVLAGLATIEGWHCDSPYTPPAEIAVAWADALLAELDKPKPE